VRDLMGYHHKSKIKIEIHIEDKKKYIVIKWLMTWKDFHRTINYIHFGDEHN
jgi:hypothetical protein